VLEIVLTEEQARVVEEADEAISIRDPKGAVIGVIDPLDAAALRKWQQVRNHIRPGIPGNVAEDHFHALEEEWTRTGGFDSNYAREFLARLRERDRS